MPTTGRDLTQALYVAAAALGRTRHAEEAIGLIQAAADVVEVAGQLLVVPGDPDDDKFVETAQTGRAERVVPGDRRLLALGSAAGVPVITAREFLDQLGGAGA